MASTTTTARSKTRSQSGITVPRKVEAVAEPVAPKKSTKANTSKPRAEAVASGRVTKPAAAKKSPAAKAKKVVKKAEEKVDSAVEKTEKKVAPKKAAAKPKTKAAPKAKVAKK